jgi:putative chitobiose transport system substrate-binding protein
MSFALIVVLCLLLGACGAGSGSSPTAGETASAGTSSASSGGVDGTSAAGEASKEPISLEFWTVSLKPAFTDFIQSIIDDFEAQHDYVTIEWVDLPWDGYQEKLVASMTAGTPPDVANLWDTLSFKAATADSLVDLNVEATPEQLAIYNDSVLASNDQNGSLYGFPWYASVPIAVYNTELFAQAGFDAPPKTMSEMFEMAPAFKEKTGAYLYCPTGLYAEVHGTVKMLNEDETKPAFNTPEMISLISNFQKGVTEDWLPRTGWGDWNEMIKMYAQGKLAMINQNTQTVTRLKEEAPDKYAVSEVAFPLLTDRGFAYTGAYYLLIPKGSKHHEEAILFANFVTNDKWQLEFCKQTAIFPTTKEATKDSYFTSDVSTVEGRARAVGAEVAGSDKIMIIDAVNVRFDDINSEIGTLQDTVINQPDADVEAAISAVEVEVQKLLDEEQKQKNS